MEQKVNDVRFYPYFKSSGIRFFRFDDGSTLRVVIPTSSRRFYIVKTGKDNSSIELSNNEIEREILAWANCKEIDYDELMLMQALNIFEDFLPFEFYEFVKLYLSKMDVLDLILFKATIEECIIPSFSQSRHAMQSGSTLKSFRIDLYLQMLKRMGLITSLGTDDVVVAPGRMPEVFNLLFKPDSFLR